MLRTRRRHRRTNMTGLIAHSAALATVARRGGAILNPRPGSLLRQRRQTGSARFASRGHESVKKSARAGRFPHWKPSIESNSFRCITVIHWDDFVDSHKTWP